MGGITGMFEPDYWLEKIPIRSEEIKIKPTLSEKIGEKIKDICKFIGE